MSENRKKNPSPRGNPGFRGKGRGRTSSNGHSHATPSHSNEYYNSQHGYDSSRSSEKQRDGYTWDEHAREVEEEELISKGLIPPRNQHTPNYDRKSDPHRNASSYGGNAPDSYNGSYNNNDNYSTHSLTPQRQPSNTSMDSERYGSETPPRNGGGGGGSHYDSPRDERSQRSADRETYQSVEDEYYNWTSGELNREMIRLQRRIDVIRDMREAAERRERFADRDYSPYNEEQHWLQNVRDGESFYDRDSAGYSPLGRQAYDTQQRRNEMGRGVIPAGRLDRYGHGGEEQQRISNGRSYDERRDERRDNGQCETTTYYNKRRRNKKKH